VQAFLNRRTVTQTIHEMRIIDRAKTLDYVRLASPFYRLKPSILYIESQTPEIIVSPASPEALFGPGPS